MSDYIIHNGTIMSEELYHHGVKGMKWGVRRYQNKDGTLTAAGKKRAAKEAMYEAHADKKSKQAAFDRAFKESTRLRNNITSARRHGYDKVLEDTANASRNADKAFKNAKKDYKNAKRVYKEEKTTERFKKHGLEYNVDTAVNAHAFGIRGAKRIENRIANKGMSRLKAESIEVGRSAITNTLVTVGSVAALGLAAGVASKYANGPAYSVLDSAGKVVRNFY